MSSAAVAASLQQSLLMPVLIRLPKQRVKAQVICLAPNAVPAAVLRQSGVPVHDVALSRQRFSLGAFGELVKAAKGFGPDVIHAWGYTAQIFANMLRKRLDRKIKVVWTVGNTTPLPRGAGMIDRQKVKYAAKAAATADRIVYASEAGAAQHRRVGFPDDDHLTIPPGIDATRFKPDPAARQKIREQLHLPPESFVIGMVAPFQPEFDHVTFLKAVGELIKTNPQICVVLAGHGVQKGNAPLMALVGGGTLGTRVQLLGEWSDLASLFNACDVVCSSALNDGARMSLVAAMLCGVPCVATGMGAQGEVIGHYGVAIESGSAPAFVKGIQRVLQLTPEKRAAMAQGARKHALTNYVHVKSLQRYLQLYYDLIGRQSLVSQEMPTPEIDASVPVPAKVGASVDKKKPAVTIADLSDPDSLEAKVTEHEAEQLPKWRLEQEQERAKREQDLSQQIAAKQSSGDVLQVFEAELSKPNSAKSAFTERARGVADESEELLSMDAIAAPAAGAPVLALQPEPAKAAAPKVEPVKLELAKDQPVNVQPKAAAAVAAAPAPAEPASVTQPLAALALLEGSVEQPTQLGLLGSDAQPAKDDSLQLELLPGPARQSG
ncbi:MAG TPA: glycosyltransferase [Steroidobacteraceae bacterium]|nr:glycosyltransferase [Steroidobacteraceae bacterium]